MTRRFQACAPQLVLVGLAALAPACADVDVGTTEAELGGADGKKLFNKGTFEGNGRTCATCHPSAAGQSGTISAADVEARFQANPNDPLFLHDGADTVGGNTFDRIREHATVLVEIPLPANVSIRGSSARSVRLARGVPTTMNTPALDPVLMYDSRAPNLPEQARGAIAGHAQSTDVRNDQLEAIADFQQTLFNRANVRAFATLGTPLAMPPGITESEKRGRRWFIIDALTDPDLAGENGIDPIGGHMQFCGFCHGGDMLNETSTFFSLPPVEPNTPPGSRMMNVLVSEVNAIGNPVYDFEFRMPDGSVEVLTSPDPGLALITGNPDDGRFAGNGVAAPSSFKINSLWGIKDTAPYFHDNSSRTLEDVVRHYQLVAPTLTGGIITLTDQNVIDIAAYMALL